MTRPARAPEPSRARAALACAVALSLAAPARTADVLRGFRPERRDEHLRLEEALVGAVDAARLRAWHDLLAAEPHVAGSAGDAAVIDAIAAEWTKLGLDVERQDVWVYLPRPVEASLAIVAPEVETLPIKETPAPGDPYMGHPELSFGWNAYSGSGDVTGAVVYANFGTKEDFAKLRELGIRCEGAVVVARYGGNFRGYKAKYAEEAGAAGLVIYSDPEDAGFVKGPAYPEGGWFSETTIQRGSVLTLPWQGDPLTPFAPATRGARRLDPADVPLPRIPVQPVGWGAAARILERMTGAQVPEAWQGGLPITYRLTGGDALRVRLLVRQERAITRTANVVGTLKGATEPQRRVVFGAHHDAWGFGAADPLSGTIQVMEAARVFAAAAARGLRPARSVSFAAWGAEEFGILGSSEWVEAHERELESGVVAYLNGDMTGMGPKLEVSSSPSLKALIEEVAGPELTKIGDLGGGSDHVGFLCHAGVASASIGGGGSQGSSYHALTDNLAWYRKVVGDDYAPAVTLTRLNVRVMARLANADVPPLDPVRASVDTRTHLEALAARAKDLGPAADLARVELASRLHELRAREVMAALASALPTLPPSATKRIGSELISHDRGWVWEGGLPGRPWFRSLFAAPDETSGYAPWMLPGLRRAIEHRDDAELARMQRAYVGVFRRLEARLDAIEAAIEEARTPTPSSAAAGPARGRGAGSGARGR
jgi:N-acetylated-alpha-linked acidic dipeptidase